MLKNFLVVVDVQNDFVNGSLGSVEAQKIIEPLSKKILENKYDTVFVTLDTHYNNYLSSREGKNLPVPHCIYDTDGWKINPEILAALDTQKDVCYIKKHTFGTDLLVSEIRQHLGENKNDFTVEFTGLCTDICVIANVVLVKTAFYESANIVVDSSCCAGVTPDKHNAALEVIKSIQVEVK